MIPPPVPASTRWIAPAAALGMVLGNWLLYDVLPGLNWVFWTVAITLVLGLITWRRHGAAGRPVYLLLAAAFAVVAGTPMTADPRTHALIALLTLWLLGAATLLAAAPDPRAVRPALLLRVPFRAPLAALEATSDELHDRVTWTRSPQARPVLRGLMITLPCIAVLGLLLSAADPVLASWRDAIGDFVPNVDALEIVFTVTLGVVLLGVWRHAATATTLPPFAPRLTIPRFGRTEYRMILGSVTALLALFISLQLTYLFGGAERLDGTGMTYAEYAHRGYVELTLVAGIVLSLVLLAERDRSETVQDRAIRPMQVALLGMVVLILASALHRITLYEDVYGYTVLRIHARVFAGLLLFTVVCVALQLWRGVDTGRLSRQLLTAGLVAVIGLTWWNDHAWIASRNIARATAHDARVPLDAMYLELLSADATPTLVTALPTLPDTTRQELQKSLIAGLNASSGDPWYAWNYRREQARAAARTIVQTQPRQNASPPSVSHPEVKH